MEIRNLEHIDFDTLFRGFERAFADYQIHFDKEEVRSMLKRRGYNPRLSFAAFDDEEIAAFTLNGIGTFGGIATAYDTGTGTVKEYRGRGLAGKIFEFSVPFLKEAGIRQYLLEVLQDNEKAISVYRKMKFEVTREFDCFRQSIRDIDVSPYPIDIQCCDIKPIDPVEACRLQSFCDFLPSWQNSTDSIERGKDGLTGLAAIAEGSPIGYCIFDPETGDLTRIAVREDFRRKGIGSRLLQEAAAGMNTDFIKVLNVSPDCHTLTEFLKKSNIPLASRQFEMILPL